ncbi:MAG: hypothetical protein KF685_13320 [Acidobacteria bacterium]|nr:hypothetical protein [Acidobacteriota bacterium]
MNKIKFFIAVSAFSLVVLALPSAASAQWYPNNRQVYRNANLKDSADRLKSDSRDFERAIDDAIDNRGSWGNRNRNNYYRGDLKQLAGDFRRAADKFEDKYGNGRNLNNSADAARDMLDAASRLENALNNSGMMNRYRGQWNSMKNDLNMVARTYGYNMNNRNTNNRNNGDWRNRVRFPLPF